MTTIATQYQTNRRRRRTRIDTTTTCRCDGRRLIQICNTLTRYLTLSKCERQRRTRRCCGTVQTRHDKGETAEVDDRCRRTDSDDVGTAGDHSGGCRCCCQLYLRTDQIRDGSGGSCAGDICQEILCCITRRCLSCTGCAYDTNDTD